MRKNERKESKEMQERQETNRGKNERRTVRLQRRK